MTGQVVILNGVPRSGKTSIAKAMQDTLAGVWINLGVDAALAITPSRLHPGIGLRPGGERPDLEPAVAQLYAALFSAIAAVAGEGLNVVSDLGIHEEYSRPLGVLPMAARILGELQVLFVGVHCPLHVIMARRNADSHGGYYLAGEGVPEPVARWQQAVHQPGAYDVEIDTSVTDPEESASRIAVALAARTSPSAFERLKLM